MPLSTAASTTSSIWEAQETPPGPGRREPPAREAARLLRWRWGGERREGNGQEACGLVGLRPLSADSSDRLHSPGALLAVGAGVRPPTGRPCLPRGPASPRGGGRQ